ncbi:MAG: FAD-dependent oxidoreductase, partial [Desulfobulbaceae bacterium]|nr:FAD-dependent oxidoreductase [Desulfobulbaceae bacterium]
MENPIDTLIIGGGLTGLTVAHFLQKYQPEAKITILEKSSSPGGAIRSFNQDGYLAEWGAHGFLDNVEASRELLADTGLDKEAQKAPLDEFVRYICLNGKLNLIPQNPKKIIRSNLVSLPAKLRVLADLWIKPRREEQTVAAWAAYRFGSSLLPFVDAVLTGTYAGDLNR